MKTKRVNNIFLNNHYSYDFVGNIKSFENTAGATTNKMAGDFSYTYTYDKLNRLKTANGNFSGYSGAPAPTFGDLSANYTLAMEYDNLHNITHKTQQHYKNNILFNENSYKNQYNYSQDKPHQLESIQDGNTTEYFGYDGNGNLHRHASVDEDWIYFWDEANRLRSAVFNGVKMMHYIYDASGERTLKAQTEYQGVFENGTPTDEGSTLTVYTTYPSPYLTISPDKKFTNHYYAGSQRIASKPAGNADRFNVMQAGEISALEELRAKQLADAQLVADSMELGQLNLAQPGSGIIIIPAVFYFHPDHLGSSTLITDNFGDPYQFFLNMPFGANERKSHAVFLEVCERSSFAEQRRSGTFNNPYKFNGKELDEETGLYYYGARYYNPRTSVWLSVDPIALWQPVQEVEHYIEGQHNGGYFNPKNMSVYGYTYQNPINYIDPNGKQIFVTHGTTQNTGKGVFSKNVLSEFKRITGNTYIDDKFSWKAPLLNNATNHRALAAKQLIKHVVSERNKLIKSGTISKDEPVTLLGYSHGGNVDIQAIDEISKQLGVKVNLITVSTPAYNSEESLKKSELAGLESPAEKTSIATHLHFVHRNDIVQSVAQGDKTYAPSSNHPVLNNIVDKYWVPIQGGIDSHTEFPRNQGFADYLKYVNSINK